MNTQDITHILKDAWKLFEEHIIVILGAYIITALFIGVTGFLMDEQSVVNIPLTVILTLIIWAITALFALGITRILLDIAEGRKPSIETLWSLPGLVPYYVGLTALQAVIVFLGFLLLIFPAVIFWIMFSLTSFAFVEKGGGILEALVESKNITHGHKWHLLLIYILLGLFNFIGMLFFGIGLIITLPFSHLVLALLYTRLRDESISPQTT